MLRHSCCEVRVMQLHDILQLRTSVILPEAISDGGLAPTTDTNLFLTTYRGGSHLPSDIVSLLFKLLNPLSTIQFFFLQTSESIIYSPVFDMLICFYPSNSCIILLITGKLYSYPHLYYSIYFFNAVVISSILCSAISRTVIPFKLSM